MFFYPTDIFHFHTFGCHLVSQLGSLLQKCDPGRCDQNLHESRLCFFTQQTFSMSIPLAVTWCPSSGPCDKPVVGLLIGRSYLSEGDVVARSPSNHTQLLLEANALLLEGDIPSRIQILPKISKIGGLYTINPFVIFSIPNDSFQQRV